MRMKLRRRSEGIACRTALKENCNSRGEIKMKKRIWSNFMPTAWLLGAAIQLWLARVSYQNGGQETAGGADHHRYSLFDSCDPGLCQAAAQAQCAQIIAILRRRTRIFLQDG